MLKDKITWKEATKLWWSWVWRSVIFGMLVGIIIGIIQTIVITIGITDEDDLVKFNIISLIAYMLSSTFCSILALKKIINKNFKGYKLVFMHTDDKDHKKPI
jgi:hypothetical protein